MGPRVREDDEIRDRKRLIDRSYEEEVGITKIRQDTSTTPLSRKNSAHRRHTTNCHSRAHGNPFIRTLRYSFGNTLATTDNKSNDNTVAMPTHNTRRTMGPRVREDDEIRDGKKKPSEDQRQRTKTLNTAATPPAVIPVHTGNHLSAHARCRVENALTATDNKSNDNTVVIPTHSVRRTMGPRVREDDEIKDGKKKPSEDQRQRTKNLHTAVTSPTVVPVHTGNHLPAHAGCRVLKMHSPQQTTRATTIQ